MLLRRDDFCHFHEPAKFAPSYFHLHHILSYKQVVQPQQRERAAAAVLSACLTKMYSFRRTEALWLRGFSHSAPLCHTAGAKLIHTLSRQDRPSTRSAAKARMSLREIQLETYCTYMSCSECESVKLEPVTSIKWMDCLLKNYFTSVIGPLAVHF